MARTFSRRLSQRFDHSVNDSGHRMAQRKARAAVDASLGQLECRRRTPGQQLTLHLVHSALQRLAKRTRLVFVEVLRGAAAPACQYLAEVLRQPIGLLGEL